MASWQNDRNTSDQIRKIKREAVLREAAHAFGRRGYHNTSLDDVAKALKIAKGTLYNYVRDKQEILYECHKEALEIGDAAMKASERGSDGAERLRIAFEYYIEQVVTNLGACAALIDVDALRPEDREKAVTRRKGFEQRLTTMVEEGIADGSLRGELDPLLVVVSTMGAINWIPRWYHSGGEYSPADLAKRMADMFMHGLLPTDRR
jgi:AcrR family transcriptional regulator